ncbi:MAG: plasmid stabilization protein [Patescibacteria group bacterium]
MRNNSELLNKTIKTLSILAKNPKHPSLKLEKLKGSRVWTIRIDKGNRIFLFWVDLRTALLIDIGKHDKYRKY